MKPQLQADLQQLAALGSSLAGKPAARCKICNGPSLAFDIVDFNKICVDDCYRFGVSGIPVLYYRCQNCSFIFTDFCDDWTNQDFATYLYNADYPLIDGEYAAIRPARMADTMAGLLHEHRAARILDYGSGTGAFAERLRAYDFATVENFDPFTSPVRPTGEFDIITCFEAIEHSPWPQQTIADLRRLLKPAGCIIFSTGIQPANIGELRANWWYVAPRNGHVSIFTLAALELLGASVGLELYAGNRELAFAGPAPVPQLAPLLHEIGPMQIAARLAAPPEQPISPLPGEALAAAAAWHEVERSGPTRFRWTGASRIEWRLQHEPRSFPCRLTLSIPVVMEIIPGFADRCRVEIGARTYPGRRAGATITVIAELDQPLARPVTLITPEPQRPLDLDGTLDDRALGLAVALAGEAG
jgi:SAM-dependent methyltransferase